VKQVSTGVGISLLTDLKIKTIDSFNYIDKLTFLWNIRYLPEILLLSSPLSQLVAATTQRKE
jgi:hypothetical protein